MVLRKQVKTKLNNSLEGLTLDPSKIVTLQTQVFLSILTFNLSTIFGQLYQYITLAQNQHHSVEFSIFSIDQQSYQIYLLYLKSFQRLHFLNVVIRTL